MPVQIYPLWLVPVAGALALAMPGCAGSRDSAALIELAGGAQRLRDARLEVQEYVSGDGEVLVPDASWPEAFRVLGPESVSVDAHGVYLTMEIDTIDAWGLYLPFDHGARPRGEGVDLSFEEVEPGVYAYRLIMGG